MDLVNLKVRPTIPVADMKRAKKFYGEKLGLKKITDSPVEYACGGGTSLVLFPSARAGSNPMTYAGWETDNVEATTKELRQKGVVFEEYDTPQTKTVNGIATFEHTKSAWFKDSEGNTLAITQIL